MKFNLGVFKNIKVISSIVGTLLLSLVLFLVFNTNYTLVFQRNSNNQSYTIVDIRGNPRNVHIPTHHNELPITVIGVRAFSSQRRLERVTFEDESKITTIERLAFAHNRNLREVYLPDSVIYLEQNAFLDNFNLTYFNINDISSLSHICIGVFSRTNIKEINLPKGLLTIGSMAFFGTKNLKSIRFPQNIRSVYKQSFHHSGLEYVYIHETIYNADILPSAFRDNWINNPNINIRSWR